MIVIQTLQLTLHQAGYQCNHQASRSTSSSTSSMLTHVYARTHHYIYILYLFIKRSWYIYNHNIYIIIVIYCVCQHQYIVIECCVWMFYFGCNIMYVLTGCHELPFPATRGHLSRGATFAPNRRWLLVAGTTVFAKYQIGAIHTADTTWRLSTESIVYTRRAWCKLNSLVNTLNRCSRRFQVVSWPNLTLLHTQTGYTLKPWHRDAAAKCTDKILFWDDFQKQKVTDIWTYPPHQCMSHLSANRSRHWRHIGRLSDDLPRGHFLLAFRLSWFLSLKQIYNAKHIQSPNVRPTKFFLQFQVRFVRFHFILHLIGSHFVLP